MILVSKEGERFRSEPIFENVLLKKGGSLSLYQITSNTSVEGAIRRNYATRPPRTVRYRNMQEARVLFLETVKKYGMRTPNGAVHIANLHVMKNGKGYKCVAICKSDRKVVATRHRDHMGVMAIAFRTLNQECGHRHRKEYRLEEYFSYLR